MKSTIDAENIKGFFGQYRWLSNFWECPVEYEGILYPSSENAYQAAKVLPEHRCNFQNIKPNESKKAWKKYPGIAPENWDKIKLNIMYEIVERKFNQNKDLAIKLIETYPKYLEETNTWRDVFWGVCKGKGENHLGFILMKVRKTLIEKKIKNETN